MMREDHDFTIRFDDSKESKLYPQGYWYVVTSDGNWDAVGSTPLNALASLVRVLYNKIKEVND